MANTRRKALKRKVGQCAGLCENICEHLIDCINEYAESNPENDIISDSQLEIFPADKYNYGDQIAPLALMLNLAMSMKQTFIIIEKEEL